MNHKFRRLNFNIYFALETFIKYLRTEMCTWSKSIIVYIDMHRKKSQPQRHQFYVTVGPASSYYSTFNGVSILNYRPILGMIPKRVLSCLWNKSIAITVTFKGSVHFNVLEPAHTENQNIHSYFNTYFGRSHWVIPQAKYVNSSRSSDAIWRHSTGSLLVGVMAHCLVSEQKLSYHPWGPVT